MESNHSAYNFEKSRGRIKDILDAKKTFYEEVDSIPSRDQLTFTNGYYVNNTSALFVDIRGSSKLPDTYKRPTLAKIYRSYVSELVAIINANEHCAEVNIHGDSVWGVFDTQQKSQVRSVFSTASTISSLINYLNCSLRGDGIDPIKVGIGMDYGRVLMVKAGYNGRGINDVVWMGDVVNQASKLCSNGNKTSNDRQIMVSEDFFTKLDERRKNLLSWNPKMSCYHGNIINRSMNDWLEENGCR